MDGLRTRAAHLAAAARTLHAASGAAAPFSLTFLTDRRRILNPEPVLRALPKGAAVIFRDYDMPRREAVARRYLSICRGCGVFFLVGGDAGLAARIGADGVHWPSGGNREPAIRRGVRHSRFPIPDSRFLITAACHNAAQLAAAAARGACLALLSPVFPTQSHPGTEHLGAARFKALAAASPTPVLALGGVDAKNAALLAGKNVAGVAVIGAFLPSLERAG
jgi:thiamine-phosphate pyrophosphorylase